MRARRLFAVSSAVALSALASVACRAHTPAEKAWPTYMKATQGILTQYDEAMIAVANIDLGLTASPNAPKGAPTPLTNDQAVAEIEKEVVSRLDKAAAQANAIEFKGPNSLADCHQLLVQGLALKADAYKTLADAYKKKDAGLFQAGTKKLSDSDALMGNFRRSFQEGVLDGGPPRCSSGGRGGNAGGQATAAPTSSASDVPPIPGLPPIPQ